jgi:hypothetical protein
MGNNCSNCTSCGWLDEKEIVNIQKMESLKGINSRQNQLINSSFNKDDFKKLNQIIYLQRKIRAFILKTKKNLANGRHRPNMSSVKMRSNRVSLTNFANEVKSKNVFIKHQIPLKLYMSKIIKLKMQSILEK